jgi:hypothetical protein
MDLERAAIEEQRYPVGRFSAPAAVTAEERRDAIRVLEEFPPLFRREVQLRGDAGLARPYRPGGWTLRQLVHHVADSHSQMSGRFRLALTEDWPTIRPYEQQLWAELADARALPAAPSLAIVEGTHQRLVFLLRSLAEADWQRGFHHPENGPERLDQVVLRYAWHSRHHLAHARAVPLP